MLYAKAYNAQTLTAQNTNPVIGEEVNYAKGPYFNPGASGMGQTWNFSAHVPGQVSSYIVLSASQAGVTSNTLCNMVKGDPELTSKKDYLSVTPNGIEIVGYNSAILQSGLGCGYLNSKTDLVYPLSIGMTFTDTWSGGVYNGPYTFTVFGTQTLTADATGTLVTFNSTYTNVIRIHAVSSYTETKLVGCNPTSTLVISCDSYSWYSPGIHTPVLVVKNYPTPGGTPSTPISIFYNLPPDPVGMLTNRNDLSELYKVVNPSEDLLIIKSLAPLMEEINTKIFDVMGKLIYEQNWREIQTIEIDVSGVDNGIYYLVIMNKEGRSSSKKVLVQH